MATNLTIPPFAFKDWLPIAKTSWRGDVIAGLTVWGLVVPESIAYTGLAGVPALSGIWAVILSLPIYFLFGHSRHLVATPTSATAVTAGSTIAAINADNPVTTMAAISLSVGVIFLLSYIFELGFVVNFISQPINAGFVFGLAIFIVVSQLHKILGVKGGDGNTFERGWATIQNLGNVNGYSLALGVIALVILFGLPSVAPKLPAGLIALGVTTAIVYFGGWADAHDVDVVGDVPTGFPDLVWPGLGLSDWGIVIIAATGIVLVAFSEASGVAKQIADEEGQEYDADGDLFAFGLGNLCTGAVGGLVAAGSMSSTSTNRDAGARTQVSGLTASFAALLTALFLAPLISSLPEAALGALIIHAIWHHLRLAFYRRISSYSTAEGRIALVATFGVLVFDVMYGLLIAVMCGFLWYLYHTTKLAAITIGPSSEYPGVMVSDYSKTYEKLPNDEIGLRFSGQLFYGNIDNVGKVIRNKIDEHEAKFKEHKPITVILDLQAQEFLDYTTARGLHRLFKVLAARGNRMILIGARENIVEAINAQGPLPDECCYTRGMDVTGKDDELFHFDGESSVLGSGHATAKLLPEHESIADEVHKAQAKAVAKAKDGDPDASA